MTWDDDAVILALRPFGEKGAVASLLTRDHGRVLGWLKASSGARGRKAFEGGTLVAAKWTARLEEQLGTWRLEPKENAYLAALMMDPLRLGALQSALSLVEAFLPEREVHSALFEALVVLCRALGDARAHAPWQDAYFAFERTLLAAAGFRLDLEVCAAGGDAQDLFYVSPKTGRAVGRIHGAPYDASLLRLPSFVKEGRPACSHGLLEALGLTQYFMERYILPHGHSADLPPARGRFYSQVAQMVQPIRTKEAS